MPCAATVAPTIPALCFPALRAGALASWLVGSATVAQGQAPAELERRSTDQERRTQEQRLEQERRTAPPDIHLPRPVPEVARRLSMDEKPCFTIRQLNLAGDESAQFEWLLEHADGQGQLDPPDPVLGRCLGAQGIQRVVDRLQSALIARGFVTSRVVAPPQNLQLGSLAVRVVPGRIESIDWAEGVAPRASRWNTVPADVGDVLNLRDVEQALENYKRVPSAEADIQIAPGTEPGTSRLIIAHRQAFPFRLSASVDDSGLPSTGKLQSSVTFSYDNWWTLSDLFYFTWTRDLGGGDPGRRGIRGQALHYSVPFGYGLLGVNHSHSRHFQTVAGAHQNYLYSGTSQQSDIKWSRVLHRDAVGKTSASLKGFVRASKNYVDDTEVVVQRRVVAGMEWGLSHRRHWTQGQVEANLQFRQGIGAWGSLPAPEELTGDGTSRMKLWLIDSTLQQTFELWGQRMSYTGHGRAQVNKTPLTPQDRMAIGGRYTVRGFDGVSVLMAERGQVLRNDIAAQMGPGHQAYIGIDAGRVAGPSEERLVGTRLAGAVLGVRGQWDRLHYDLFVGRPLHMPGQFTTSAKTAGFSLTVSL